MFNSFWSCSSNLIISALIVYKSYSAWMIFSFNRSTLSFIWLCPIAAPAATPAIETEAHIAAFHETLKSSGTANAPNAPIAHKIATVSPIY